MKKLLIVSLILLTLTGFASASANIDPSVIPCVGDPPLIIGGGWQSFNGNGLGWAGEIFTFSSDTSVCIYVTDLYLPGDVFEIYDNGVLIGATSEVPVGTIRESDPDAAYASDIWSSGKFTVPGGSHTITIKSIQEWGGVYTAKIKAEAGPCSVPEFPTLAIPMTFVGGFLMIASALRREH